MTTLRCVDLAKRYAGQDDYSLGGRDGGISFEVQQGELFALLGPSGRGKTTTLRIIGGFVDADRGRVEVAGEDVTTKPAHSRATNTVFQSYALFPHLSVAGNVEFGLKMDSVARAQRRSRTLEALETVGMAEMADRRIAELSGGQQQRVALARAMVKKPAVLLLDEPFGALDLRLRRQMQDELVRLKQATGTTFVHVTHDQEEACAIADRVAVMNRGHIIQVDTPVELYRAPRTDFVAEFLNVGTVLRGEATREGADIRLETCDLRIYASAPDWVTDGMGFCAVVPPDRITITSGEDDRRPDQQYATATVEHLAFTGTAFLLHLVLGDNSTQLTAEIPRDGISPSVHPGSQVVASWHRADVIIVEDTGSLVSVDPEEAEAPAA